MREFWLAAFALTAAAYAIDTAVRRKHVPEDAGILALVFVMLAAVSSSIGVYTW